MDNGPDERAADKAPVALQTRSSFPWPWGLIAIGVIALAWVGIYLMWNGILFLVGG